MRQSVQTPTAVVNLGAGAGVQALAGGGEHSCAIVNGSVKCWGNNDDGQLGNGTTSGSHVPVAVSAWAP